MARPSDAQTGESDADAGDSRSSEKSLANDEELTCPKCGGAIGVDDVICPHCEVPLVGG